MMQRALIAMMLLGVLFIAACAPQNVIRAQPLNTSQPAAPDACASVNCSADMRCADGACVCDAGQKKCGDSCIAASKCCSDRECGAGRFCQSGVCAEQPVCKFNEAWDAERKECSCAEGAKFCKEQGKCIPAKSCCWHNDCERRFSDFRCAPTTYSADVCIKGETKKCRIIHEGTTQTFFFTDQDEYSVRLQQVLEGGRFSLRVHNETMKSLAVNETVQFNNLTVFVENLQVFGGTCREFPE